VIEDQRTSIPITRRFTVSTLEHWASGTVVDALHLALRGAIPAGS
jgi:hypothetical protein